MPLVAGVDCSTQATKVIVVDSDTGLTVASGKAEHEVTGTGGARETHPEVWWDALKSALTQTGKAREVAALAVGGQQHGLVVLDSNGTPLRAAPLWNDTRAASDADRLIESLGGPTVWADRVGLVPVASYTVCKWAWLRRVEPGVAASTRQIRLPHDYLNGRLTANATTDRGDASGTGWWSTKDERYDQAVLSLPEVDLEESMLPTVLGPLEQAGELTDDAARETGLAPGTVVGPGTGDNMAAAVGLGLEPGTPVISLGTSGTAYMSSPTRAADSSGTVSGFADATGRFLPLTATLNCTLAIDRFALWLGLDREDVAPSTDVVVFPYLDGERTPNLPEAAGVVSGLRHTTTNGEILLAAYEGAALGLIEALARVATNSSGLEPSAPLVLIGGGARGKAWREVVRRLSGRWIQVPDAQELVALGAAAQAAACLTGEAPDEVARRWNTRAGAEYPAVARDERTIERIHRAREQIRF